MFRNLQALLRLASLDAEKARNLENSPRRECASVRLVLDFKAFSIHFFASGKSPRWPAKHAILSAQSLYSVAAPMDPSQRFSPPQNPFEPLAQAAM